MHIQTIPVIKIVITKCKVQSTKYTAPSSISLRIVISLNTFDIDITCWSIFSSVRRVLRKSIFTPSLNRLLYLLNKCYKKPSLASLKIKSLGCKIHKLRVILMEFRPLALVMDILKFVYSAHLTNRCSKIKDRHQTLSINLER